MANNAFSMHDYCMTMLEKMRGSKPDWQIMDYAQRYFERGYFTAEDLEIVYNWFVPVEDEPIEEEQADIVEPIEQ